ncbi:MAG: hypothetical protein KIS81_08585 [Maricaulaceae bacterium]|nr:hypothetical protein [Maricaulaceae bacterium]
MAALGLPPGQAAETGADALAEAGLVNLVLAIGALGVAAYGLVDNPHPALRPRLGFFAHQARP